VGSKSYCLAASGKRGFLVWVLWFVLFVLGLIYEGEDVIVRIYILFGAIGIISAARWCARTL
jgi:hypothetical protein